MINYNWYDGNDECKSPGEFGSPWLDTWDDQYSEDLLDKHDADDSVSLSDELKSMTYMMAIGWHLRVFRDKKTFISGILIYIYICAT